MENCAAGVFLFLYALLFLCLSFCTMFSPHISSHRLSLLSVFYILCEHCLLLCLWPVGSKLSPLLYIPCEPLCVHVACHVTVVHSGPPFMHVITNRPVGPLRHSAFLPGLRLHFHPAHSPPIISLPPLHPFFFPLFCPRPVSPPIQSCSVSLFALFASPVSPCS